MKLLRDEAIGRVVSSPYVRCIETVAPLAADRALAVDEADALAEGSPLSEALRLIEKVADRPTVLCAHGDVVTDLLSHLEDRRVPLEGGLQLAKGSTWVLDVEGGEIVRGRYLPPAA